MKAYKRISVFMAGLLAGALHALAFLLGVGVVSSLYKIVGRRLLSQGGQNSTWETASGSSDVSKMY